MLTPVTEIAERRLPVRRGPFYEFACATIDEFVGSGMAAAEVTGWPKPPKGRRRVLSPDSERVATALRDRARSAKAPVAVRMRSGRVYLERKETE